MCYRKDFTSIKYSKVQTRNNATGYAAELGISPGKNSFVIG
jgi:hypothetical protein